MHSVHQTKPHNKMLEKGTHVKEGITTKSFNKGTGLSSGTTNGPHSPKERKDITYLTRAATIVKWGS
jgi:hypothetical protein